MNNKKLLLIAFATVLLFGIGIFIIQSGNSLSSYIESQLTNYGDGQWIVRIDNDAIGESFIRKRTELYKKYILKNKIFEDKLLQDKLLKKAIDNYIVIQEAQKSDIFESDKFKEYLWLYTEELMANYYLDSLASAKKGSALKLTKKEVKEIYTKYKKAFDKRGIKEVDALAIIEKQASGFEDRMSEKHKLLTRKIELGKLKKTKKIKVNTSLLKK